MHKLCPCCHRETDPRQELETLGRCFEAISDLVIPEKNLHIVNRDNLALLLGYLNNRHRAALTALFEKPDKATGEE